MRPDESRARAPLYEPGRVTHARDEPHVDDLRRDATFEWHVDRAVARLADASVSNLLKMRDAHLKARTVEWAEDQTADYVMREDAEQEAVYRVLARRDHFVRGKAGRRARALVARGRGKSKDR